ncbi:MAG: hypothetical protein V7733_20845 [Paraglaciecola polaris]|uniref:DUF7281 domain-containing protein n=1 Tax=Paraglaciecola polaris TaxID=222814 RepID=UPI003003918C|tara:strand:+ start:5881 stop:6768 length:888 start_codon:yes stop_codon:yes gene_type:complete
MTDALTPKAKALLKEQYFALMYDDSAFTQKVATVKQITTWCEQAYIEPGHWLVMDKRYRFHRDAIEAIRDAYQMSMGEDIFTDFSQDTHQSAAQKSADEKQGSIKPTHHLILCALTQPSIIDRFKQDFYPSQQVNIELDIRALDVSGYDALLMIENRDSFNDWHVFSAQVKSDLQKVLVFYRGDSHYSVAASHLLQQWRKDHSAKPVIYFGDFDLMGVRIAVGGQCTHLLLPTYAYLDANLVPQHFPVEQEKLLAGLRRDCPSSWQSLIGLMACKRAGLRQQKMYRVPLALYPAQ